MVNEYMDGEYVPPTWLVEKVKKSAIERQKPGYVDRATAQCRWCWVRMTTARLHKHVDVCKDNPNRESE
jgi:hypothetical protein